MKYNTNVVLAYFDECGLPMPELEWRFHPERKWRFDFAWPSLPDGCLDCKETKIACEVEGGLWISGGHSRGSGRVKDIEKYSEAACLGWRILYCQPKDLCTMETVNRIKRCLGMI